MIQNKRFRHGFTVVNMLLTVVMLLLFVPGAQAKAKKVSDVEWTGVNRIVAVGDLHGDWDGYMRVMQAAGLLDGKGKWAGGDTHLVQTGDIPDRGPDTREIIDHLQKLKKEAKKKGGAVHTLIGNHDAMNVYGDLRYVHAGEYAAFTGKSSKRLQDAQYDHYVNVMESRDPEFMTSKNPEAFRAAWEKDYPLGWVEHRQAWAPRGDYGELVLDNPAVLKVNDTLFLHGGLSAKFCDLSLKEVTQKVHFGIANYDFNNPGIVEDPLGPLWYRGLAMDNEQLRSDMVSAILKRYGASRIVVGHTPTSGVVWPRFDARVILNDTGIAQHYGGHMAFLEIKGDELTGHYAGGALPIPASNDQRVAYLEKVVAMDPGNPQLQSRLQKLVMNPDPGVLPVADSKPESEMSEEEKAAAAAAAQQEAWLSPDNCQ